MKKIWLVLAGIIVFCKYGYALWENCRIDTAGDVGKYTSICSGMYSFCNFCASYYDSTNGNLKIIGVGHSAEATTGVCVDTAGDVGKYTSITNWDDSSGQENLMISYYDVTNGNLKVARRKNPSDTFVVTTIDSTGDVGLFTSLYVDTALKRPYISYYDATNGDLKLAYFSDTNWVIQKIDTAGDVGMHTSITGYKDTVYISYYDATNGDLKFATYDTSGWQQIEVIDKGQYICCIFWNDPPSLYVAYYCTINGDLIIAQRNGVNWDFSNADTAGDVGLFCNSNNPWGVHCYDKTNGNLKFSGYSAPEIIDSAGDVGGFCSGGNWYSEIYLVVYYDFTNGDLKEAWTGGAVEEQNANASASGEPNFQTFHNKILLSTQNAIQADIKLYDLCGRMREVVYSGTLSKGSYTFVPKIQNTGIYFVKLNTGKSTTVKKLILMK